MFPVATLRHCVAHNRRAASFHTVIAQVPGSVTDGRYAFTNPGGPSGVPGSAPRIPRQTGALLGASAARTFTMALEEADPDLTGDSFLAALETSNTTTLPSTTIREPKPSCAWREVIRFE